LVKVDKRGFLGLKGHIMRNIASAVGVVAVAAATFLSPGPATAENGQIAAGVVGGLIGGALLGGALASRPAPPPVYYAPAPVYVEEPVCRFVRERYWDGFGWVHRRVEVCDWSSVVLITAFLENAKSEQHWHGLSSDRCGSAAYRVQLDHYAPVLSSPPWDQSLTAMPEANGFKNPTSGMGLGRAKTRWR
jgi:hypothetical protein